MARIDATTAHVLAGLATDVRLARTAIGMSQARLARELGVSQSSVARLEGVHLPNLSIRQAVKVVARLGGKLEVRVSMPARAPDVRDDAHVRCVTYVARRLQLLGYHVSTEVEVGLAAGRGIIDVLAFHPALRILGVVEVKTELVDLGELERQLRRHADGAPAAARLRGWQARSTLVACVVLATRVNDARLAEHRGFFDRVFPMRSTEIGVVIRGGTALALERWGIAMIDPRSRGSSWLTPTRIDGRRRPARHADRLDYLASARRPAKPHAGRARRLESNT